MKIFYLLILSVPCAMALIIPCLAMASERAFTTEVIPYKELSGQDPLVLKVYTPSAVELQGPLPAILFFFGGGWQRGDITHFEEHAIHLAKRGMIAICVQYRTEDSHGATPDVCLEDAWDATAFIHKRAKELNIDPEHIGAGGGSAGGHLAAATAFCSVPEGHHEAIRPRFLILFNPVIDNSPDGYGYERVSDFWERFSPLHNIGEYLPPTLFMIGDSDPLIPLSTARAFQKKLNREEAVCRLIIYESAAHGFFNKGKTSPNGKQYFEDCIEDMDDFLVSLGYLSPE